MSVTGEADGPPTLVGESAADVVSGLFASWAILAALNERHVTGLGQHLDIKKKHGGITLGKAEPTMGLRGAHAFEFSTDTRAPVANILGEEG